MMLNNLIKFFFCLKRRFNCFHLTIVAYLNLTVQTTAKEFKGIKMVLSSRQNPKHRNCFYIVNDILGVVTLYADPGITKIMYKASLSFEETRDYLNLMLDAELLEAVKSGERTKYRATEKGHEYIWSFGKTKQLLKPVQQSDNQAVAMPPEHLLARAHK